MKERNIKTLKNNFETERGKTGQGIVLHVLGGLSDHCGEQTLIYYRYDKATLFYLPRIKCNFSTGKIAQNKLMELEIQSRR